MEVARAQNGGLFGNPHQKTVPFGAVLRTATRVFCARFAVGGVPATPKHVAPSALNRASRDGRSPLPLAAGGGGARGVGGAAVPAWTRRVDGRGGRAHYRIAMGREVAKGVKARRLRTGEHVHPVTLRLDAGLLTRVEAVARKTGFARAVIARAAMEQGLGTVERTLGETQDEDVGRKRAE